MKVLLKKEPIYLILKLIKFICKNLILDPMAVKELRIYYKDYLDIFNINNCLAKLIVCKKISNIKDNRVVIIIIIIIENIIINKVVIVKEKIILQCNNNNNSKANNKVIQITVFINQINFLKAMNNMLRITIIKIIINNKIFIIKILSVHLRLDMIIIEDIAVIIADNIKIIYNLFKILVIKEILIILFKLKKNKLLINNYLHNLNNSNNNLTNNNNNNSHNLINNYKTSKVKHNIFNNKINQ